LLRCAWYIFIHQLKFHRYSFSDPVIRRGFLNPQVRSHSRSRRERSVSENMAIARHASHASRGDMRWVSTWFTWTAARLAPIGWFDRKLIDINR